MIEINLFGGYSETFEQTSSVEVQNGIISFNGYEAIPRSENDPKPPVVVNRVIHIDNIRWYMLFGSVKFIKTEPDIARSIRIKYKNEPDDYTIFDDLVSNPYPSGNFLVIDRGSNSIFVPLKNILLYDIM